METYLKELIAKEGTYKKWVYKCENGIEYTCEIRRNPRGLHLCGYVLLTEDSDYYGVEYDDIRVDCHGFDCAHLTDLQPGYDIHGGEYRTMDYVMNECESICEQISVKSKAHRRTYKLNELI